MFIPGYHLFWVLPLGILLIIGLSMSQGILGQQRKERLALISLATFGKSGAQLMNLLMAIGLVGWSGFHGGVSGASMAELFHLPGWMGALLIISLIYLLNSLGINRWAALTWVTTGAALALTIFALAAVYAGGTEAKLTLVHVAPTLSMRHVLWALGTIVGYATLFSLRTPDFTWDFAARSDVVTVKLFLILPLLFGMSVGALLYRATGHWNIADVLAQTQSATLGHLFLIVAVISPLISGWYSGAFALSYLTPLTPNQSTLLICLLGFVLAAGRFDQQLLPFLGYLGAALGSALVVILLAQRVRPQPTMRHACLAWLSGAGVAIICHAWGLAGQFFVGAGVAAIVLGVFWWAGRGAGE